MDQFERFGQQQPGNSPSIRLLMGGESENRLQIISQADDRVIQLQKTRFVYNWRKRGSIYPGFGTIYQEFLAKPQAFRDFLKVAGLGDISPNQWEISYINQIPKNDLWKSVGDWYRVFPGLYLRQFENDSVRFESIDGTWHFEIVPQLGRLRISGRHGRISEDGTESLILDLTGRGPIEPDTAIHDISSGLELGHRVLVQTFAALSSDTAHQHWGKRP